MRRKVLYIVSHVTDSTEYQLIVDHWDRTRLDLEFVLLNREADCSIQRYIRAAGFPCTTYIYQSRRDAIGTIRTLMRHLRASRPDVINTNLLEATFYGLIAAWLTGIGKRTYTRHLAAHNHKYHPFKGVLYDRICNMLAHRIIAISTGTEEVLVKWEGVRQRKVVMIHHGYDMSRPHAPHPEKLARLKAKHGLDREGPVIGVVSRPFALKGLDHSIPAIARIVEQFPDACAWFFNWKPTPQSDHFDRLLAALPEGSWRTVHFEPEVAELFHAFDVFIHVSEDKNAEAFGLVYIEAAMAGTPSVFTRSGIMHDLDPTRMAGVRIVPFKDPSAIADAACAWLRDRPSAAQRAEFARQNTDYMRGIIDISIRMRKLFALYESI